MKALVADDSSTMRLYMQRILAHHGFDSVHAVDGEEALSKLTEGLTPDLILLDWNMPLRDGFETLKAIRQRERWDSIPVMMVTTEIDMHEVVQALQAGANE